MSAETEVYAALAADSTLAALVSNADGLRVYPDALPEDGLYPAIVYSRDATDPQYTISGDYYGSFVTISIQCWASKRGIANNVGVAVINALVVAGLDHNSRQVGFDPETGLFATLIGIELYEQPVATSGGLGLLTEDGNSLITESGDHISIEVTAGDGFATEGGDILVTEDGDRITI